jgi:hypothetical protein
MVTGIIYPDAFGKKLIGEPRMDGFIVMEQLEIKL